MFPKIPKGAKFTPRKDGPMYIDTDERSDLHFTPAELEPGGEFFSQLIVQRPFRLNRLRLLGAETAAVVELRDLLDLVELRSLTIGLEEQLAVGSVPLFVALNGPLAVPAAHPGVMIRLRLALPASAPRGLLLRLRAAGDEVP